MARLLCLVLFVCVGASTEASAQSGLQVQTQVSTRRVEVGQIFQLQLTALGDADSPPPSAPRLQVPPGFSVQGPTVSSQQQVSIINGSIQQRQGITASWLVSSSKAGIFTVGPPSVAVAGQRARGQAVQIEVVPRGQSAPGAAPRGSRQPVDPFDPFDFFRKGMPSLPGLDVPDPDALDQLDMLPPVPEEYRVERAPDRTAFLRATASPMRAVLGQQVTLSVYAYGCRGPFREANTSEPSKADFLSYSIVDNAQNERVHRVAVDGSVCIAVKIREIALFPIRSGTLKIGPMRMAFDGRGYNGGVAGQGLMRESAPLEVQVSEPPLAERPPGYELGTVGRFSLSGSVEPREITAGDAISVRVKLEGVGNLPHKLSTPQQDGVEWLAPTTVEEIEPENGRIQGFRKWSYVVRISKAGHVELGSIELPFWDVQRRRYDSALFELGGIDVKASDRVRPAEQRPKDDPLRTLVAPRATLGEPARATRQISDQSWFWFALAAGPLSVLLVTGGVSAGDRLRKRLRERRTAATARASQALSEARAAAARGDHPSAAGGAERAVFNAIESATELRPRAVLKEQLPRELEAHGIPSELASETAKVLQACDDLRFAGGSDEAATQLVERAAALVSALNKAGGARRRARSE
jgi:hypothetical protein